MNEVLTIDEATAKKWPVALYVDLDAGTYSVKEVQYVDYDEHYGRLPPGQLRELARPDQARVSEITEVSVQGVKREEVVAKVMDSLNQQEREAIEELNRTLAMIKERKNQLLAISYEEPKEEVSDEAVLEQAGKFDDDIPF